MSSHNSTFFTGNDGHEPRVIAGRYELVAQLGEGGMGAVFKAHDRQLDEFVAIKLLHAELASHTTFYDRFRQEVKLARRVTHPCVVRTFDLGEDEGDRYLTMEFVDGESLSGRIDREGPLPIADVKRIGVAVCLGIAAAHTVGVVHRDLKPDNVMLGHDGRVLVTDFGIARAVSAEHSLTKTKAGWIGTPAYMAPEQVLQANVDYRTDLFALGLLLYEMVGGDRPWHGETPMATAMLRLTKPPRPLTELRPDVPADLVQLIMDCLAIEASYRPESASAVADRLHAIDDAPAYQHPGDIGRDLVFNPFGSDPFGGAEPLAETFGGASAPVAEEKPDAWAIRRASAPLEPIPEPKALVNFDEPKPKVIVIREEVPSSPIGPRVVLGAVFLTLAVGAAALALAMALSSPPERPEVVPAAVQPLPPPVEVVPEAVEAVAAPPKAVVPSGPPNLFVFSVPVATVKVDKKRLGNSEGFAKHVKSGSHDVVLVTADGREVKLTTLVGEEGASELCWDFDAKSYCSASRLAELKAAFPAAP